MITQKLVELPGSLQGGGDSFEHYHSSDRTPTHDTLSRLQQLNRQNNVTGPYTLIDKDDIILADTAGPLQLPVARNGREFEIIMIGIDPVTVNLTHPDTIYGDSSVTLTIQSTALRFKAITGGWVFI